MLIMLVLWPALVMASFLLSMVVYSEVQRNAEIDCQLVRVVDNDHLPNFDHCDDLSLLFTTLTESVRWGTTALPSSYLATMKNAQSTK